MIEPLVALAVCFGVSVYLRIHHRYFVQSGVRDLDFERWIASDPVVLAFRPLPGHETEVSEAVRQSLVGPAEFVNDSGNFPWQHYLLRLAYERLQDGVIGVRIVSVIRRRPGDKRPPLSGLVTAIAALGASSVEQVWLHGELHGKSRERGTRERMGWTGRLLPDGVPDVTGMIGQPGWLVDGMRRAA